MATNNAGSPTRDQSADKKRHIGPPAARRLLLDGVSGCFQSGAVTLVVGSSGAGKSTLLQSAAGLHAPDSGTVHVDNLALYRGLKPRREALLRVGYVAQFPEEQLFASTVKKELRYSLRPYRLTAAEESKRIEAALVAGGLPPAMGELSPLTLSGGQKRRVALASSMAPRTPWLIMDEPTAGLDAKAMERMLGMLSEWKHSESRGNSPSSGGIIIASHHIGPMLPYVDSVWMLKDGRLLGIYSALEVLENPELLVDAGVGVPDELRLRAELGARGVVIPATHIKPADVASAILASRHRQSLRQQGGTTGTNGSPTSLHVEPRVLSLKSDVGPRVADTSSGIDPRAKWGFFTCLTAGLFVQNSWTGLLVFALVLGLVSRFARVRIMALARTLSPILWLMVFSVCFSALTLSFRPTHSLAVGMDWHRAQVTLRGVCEFALAIGVGSLIPATMTRLEMKRGLEFSLWRLSRIGVPVEAVSLSLTLILRFLPLLQREVARFCTIATSRAKVPAKPGRLRPFTLPSAIIPLLLAVLRLGEDFATALEARGLVNFYSRKGEAMTLRMNRASVVLIVFGGVLFLGLFSLRLLQR